MVDYYAVDARRLECAVAPTSWVQRSLELHHVSAALAKVNERLELGRGLMRPHLEESLELRRQRLEAHLAGISRKMLLAA